MAKAPSLSLPTAIADEIAATASRAERSVAFLVLGALKAAGKLEGAVDGAKRSLAMTSDEDDPRDLGARLKKLVAEKAGGRSLDEALALAWTQRRTQILAWVERVAAINAGEQADDLDEGLKVAADPATPASQLLALAKSPYPKVRALVAAHKNTTDDIIAILRADKDSAVRDALDSR